MLSAFSQETVVPRFTVRLPGVNAADPPPSYPAPRIVTLLPPAAGSDGVDGDFDPPQPATKIARARANANGVRMKIPSGADWMQQEICQPRRGLKGCFRPENAEFRIAGLRRT